MQLRFRRDFILKVSFGFILDKELITRMIAHSIQVAASKIGSADNRRLVEWTEIYHGAVLQSQNSNTVFSLVRLIIWLHWEQMRVQYFYDVWHLWALKLLHGRFLFIHAQTILRQVNLEFSIIGQKGKQKQNSEIFARPFFQQKE